MIITDNVAATLAHTALKNLFDKNELQYDFYQEVLNDLEAIYITEPVKTFDIYIKYNI